MGGSPVKPVPLIAAAAAVGWVVWRRKKLGKVEAGFWILAAVGLVLYGTGLIHPPSAESVIREIGARLGKWTYLLVGALAFLETGAFVGLVAPGEATILLGGFVAGQGKISVVVLLAIVWGAAVAGDVTSYFLGRRLGREFLLKHGDRLKLTHERLEKIEGFFDRFGGSAILLGRFVGLIRAFAPFIAGASKLELRRFLPYDIVGAGLWGCGLVVLGYVFWQSFDQVLKFAKQGALALGLTIAAVVGLVALIRFLKEEENRRKVDAWLDAHAEDPRTGPLVRVARLGWRRALLPAGRFAAWVAPGRFGLEVITLLAAVGVGGFAFGALANLVGDHDVLPLDRTAFDLVDPLRTGLTVDIGKVFTNGASLPAAALIVVATAAFLAARRRRPDAVALVAGLALTWLAVHIAKGAIDRPRPAGGLTDAAGAAYPSGHAAYSVAWVACALVLARVAPGLARRLGLAVVALVLALLLGLSRVFLGVHWISDVYGGWGLGVACFGLCGLTALVIGERRQNARGAST